MALLSMRADRFWKKTGKKITIQGSDVARFDKSKVECFNCHKLGYFAERCIHQGVKTKYHERANKKEPKVMLESKPIINFVKESGCPNASKVNNIENSRKPTLKVELNRNITQSPNVRSNNFGPPIIKVWDSEDESDTESTPIEFIRKTREKLFKASTLGFKPKKISGKGKPLDNIDDKGFWDSGCSRHMTGNISYLSDYEPYDRGYVSFGYGGGKITGKGTIKTGKLEFENVHFVKELKYNLCDNGGEFRNKEMEDFCSRKGIKREFSNARTPQQNGGLQKRRNRTLIEACQKTIWLDAKFLYLFGDEVVTLACYVPKQSTIEENLHINFLESKVIDKAGGLKWLFDIESLTKSMNYIPVVSAGTSSSNISGTKEDVKQVRRKGSPLRFIALPNWFHEARNDNYEQ
ncbi:putative ribonuclease H-like domain-containing protein [Tanacetum coccineum]|uniref:Ribonuclease H-like domain-containing protein n=1 Tax=Tanacetum coccineum TaxID=301880 RepID=A0ABQ5DN66_9ASTR